MMTTEKKIPDFVERAAICLYPFGMEEVDVAWLDAHRVNDKHVRNLLFRARAVKLIREEYVKDKATLRAKLKAKTREWESRGKIVGEEDCAAELKTILEETENDDD